MQDIESDTGYDTRRRSPDGALAVVFQTTVYDTCRSTPPASRWQTKADGSHSLAVPAERGAVLRRAAEEFEQRVFLATLNDIRNFYEAYAGSRNRGRSPG